MKYIIMADGKGLRWNDPNTGLPKHLVKVNGERVIDRTVRLIKKYDFKADIIITSHDKRYGVEGATRYEPKNNNLEIDRFTEELIEDNICFIYGDTYYQESQMEIIINKQRQKYSVDFFGNSKSIVAIKVYDSRDFKYHVDNVRSLFLRGKIKKCIGWQVYASYTDSDFDGKKIGKAFTLIDNMTTDFNKYDEYVDVIKKVKCNKKD